MTDLITIPEAIDWLKNSVDDDHGHVIELLKSMGWQPIETAPKDGTYILACRLPFSDQLQNVYQVKYDTVTASDFVWGEVGGYSSHNRTSFTHWMPLPAPNRSE